MEKDEGAASCGRVGSQCIGIKKKRYERIKGLDTIQIKHQFLISDPKDSAARGIDTIQ